MDYDRGDVSTVYREARALPAETMALWRDVLAELVPERPLARVLDLGCGTARFTRLLARTFESAVTGIDPSRGMLAQREDAAGARFVAAAGEALPVRAAFERFCRAAPPGPVVEPVDVFVFRRA